MYLVNRMQKERSDFATIQPLVQRFKTLCEAVSVAYAFSQLGSPSAGYQALVHDAIARPERAAQYGDALLRAHSICATLTHPFHADDAFEIDFDTLTSSGLSALSNTQFWLVALRPSAVFVARELLAEKLESAPTQVAPSWREAFEPSRGVRRKAPWKDPGNDPAP